MQVSHNLGGISSLDQEVYKAMTVSKFNWVSGSNLAVPCHPLTLLDNDNVALFVLGCCQPEYSISPSLASLFLSYLYDSIACIYMWGKRKLGTETMIKYK